MKSFFSRIKGKMSQRFGGRYLGEVLAEVFRQEPSMTEILWGKKIRNFSIVTYNDYLESCGGSRKRIADLTVISKDSGEPIARAEIKYDDEKTPFSDIQLEDYLKNASGKKIHFTYLTKNFLPKKQRGILAKYKLENCHLLYSQLGENLDKWIEKNPDNCYGRLLADFLRDEGVMWNKKFNEKAIKTLIIKAGRFPHKSGHGKLVSESRMTKDVPAAFAGLMSNIAILGRVVHDEFDPKKELVSTTPSTDFSFDPHYSIKALRKLLENENAEDSEDELVLTRWENAVVGGDFSVKSLFTVPGDPYLGFLVYLCFSLKKGGEGLETSIGARVYGDKLEDTWQSFEPFQIKVDDGDFNLDEKKIRTLALKHIVKAISNCVRGEKQLEKTARARLVKIEKVCANKTR